MNIKFIFMNLFTDSRFHEKKSLFLIKDLYQPLTSILS